MKASTLLFKIESNMDQFSPAEKKVAMYIMGNAEIVPNLTTKEVSTNAGASEASVVRFCKSIGIGSFKAFKIALVRELTIADYNINDFSVMNTEDGPYDLFNKVTYVNKAAIEASVTAIDKKELEKAADLIVNADKIIFYGVGGSATPAMDGAYKFTRLGFTAMMLSDFHMMLPLVTTLKEGDIFVAISTSGRTKDVLEMAQYAKRQGATVIAITKLDQSSPLYKEADIRLCMPDVEQDHRIASIASRMTQLNMIDALYVITFNRIGNKVLDQFMETREEALRLRKLK
ncbi:MurR/RpiR family transcriptional regulator [Bacillus wiedmannii]|uniref:MurR/RpiR family transcriptional regulator n=1 Tax=Bacillus wiedmannii TaxID=1890302 RepID=UPI000BF9D411|nr:MurR/RpiR family transcriptional regulator [Bacillus wiedmannii]PEP76002.1 MurR/RpiR family transcriptional regulator [Bacillus wiedmannii]PGB93248.1 MurR/RpiR family transcriptional regulator [Bacillus wiedmannii]PHB53427.1 MurR/RpiR family transcriptional regulator [Bacillus wiedmannii]